MDLAASSSSIVHAATLVQSAESLPGPHAYHPYQCRLPAFAFSLDRHLSLQQVCSACSLCPASSMQKCETDTLENGRQLTYGDYRDASRALRRSLKQLGSGALEAGIRQLTASEAAAEEVAALIGVNAQVRVYTWTSVEGDAHLVGASALGRHSPVRLLLDVDAQASGAPAVLSWRKCVSRCTRVALQQTLWSFP